MEAKPNKLRMGLVAAIAVVSVLLLISKARSSWHWSSQDPGDVLSVMVANRYIPAFSVIKPEMVREQDFPKGLVPPGAIKSKSELTNENGQFLFTSVISVPEGQPVTRALVADASQNDTLGSLIRPGKVAVSFEIDRAHGVGGWIRPGDTVALFGATPMRLGSAKALEQKTRLLFPSVVVVAVDDKRLGQVEKDAEKGQDPTSVAEIPSATGSKIITVLVSPLEASSLIEAREDGSISVVLRSLGDDIPWPKEN